MQPMRLDRVQRRIDRLPIAARSLQFDDARSDQVMVILSRDRRDGPRHRMPVVLVTSVVAREERRHEGTLAALSSDRGIGSQDISHARVLARALPVAGIDERGGNKSELAAVSRSDRRSRFLERV